MHETAERLLLAAQELLQEQGEAATTLRDITERAGTNVAAVNYHYRSKDALIAAAFHHALAEVTELQRGRLQALAPEADLREIVRVWLGPGLDRNAPGSREHALWGLIARGMREESPGLVQAAASASDVVGDELVPLLASRLPHLSEGELLVRHAATLAALSALSSGALTGALGTDITDTTVAEWFVDWAVAGLSGPGDRRPGSE